jgi:hypothetical protein
VFKNRPDWFLFRGSHLTEVQFSILKDYYPFFHLLDKEQQITFKYKVSVFLKIKKFVPRQLDHITEEMKVLIAASAAQLTLGLTGEFLRYFKFFVIYPEDFKSQATGKYHKGEVSMQHKAIVLSWKSFVDGFSNLEGRNVALHEMAHALHLEDDIKKRKFGRLAHKNWQKWDHMAFEEIRKMKAGVSEFFRPYGATNPYEFFAVAVEEFFERPEAFSRYRPELYLALAQLLNQNPLDLLRK